MLAIVDNKMHHETNKERMDTRSGALNGEPPRGRGKFIPKERFLALFEGAPPIDYKQLRADIDAFVDHDPAPRG